VTAAATALSRLPETVRAGYGAALLLAPGPMLRLCTGHPAGPAARRVGRLLGARQLIQAALTAGTGPSATGLRIGAAVDLAHATSMAGLAIADRRVRAAAAADTLMATVFAATGLGQARLKPG
jgi:hypothetical protein